MDAFKTMTIISCVMSTITTIAMCTAILPHIKKGMVVVRDAVLWSAFVLIIFVAGWLGLEKIRTRGEIVVPQDVSVSSDKQTSGFQDKYYSGD